MLPLYLASNSPQRSALLSQLNIPFNRIPPSKLAEQEPKGDLSTIVKIVRENAVKKAKSVAQRLTRGLVLAGDTVVVSSEGEVLLKPHNAAIAFMTLRKLVGRWHQVVSAVALLNLETAAYHVRHTTTRVWFRNVPDAALRRYIETGESIGKAGAYALQGRGSFLIRKIAGSYTGVIGLPLEIVVTLLELFEMPVWQYWKGK